MSKNDQSSRATTVAGSPAGSPAGFPTASEPKTTNPDGRGASNTGDVADQEAADKAASDAKSAELAANAPGGIGPDGRSVRAGTPTGPQDDSLKAGANNPADGTPIQQPTNDATRPDATKGPLHNPGVVVEPGMADPSPTTAVSPGSATPTVAKRDMTDPSRKH